MWFVMVVACGGSQPVEAPPAAPEPSEEVVEAPPEEPEEVACTDLFRCDVAGGKELGVCGTGSGLQYRFGPKGAPELVFPETPGKEPFAVEERSFVRSMGDALVFANGEYRYEVTEMSGSGAMGEGEANNFVGVVVSKGDDEVARISCAGDVTSDWAGLRKATE